MNKNNKTGRPVVLVCPLSWGLGHATRSIPIIDLLLKKNCIVYVGGAGKIISLVKDEFGNKVNYIDFGGMNIRYGAKYTYLKLILQAPLFIYFSIKEHYKLKRLIKVTGAKTVISDNRYGLWSKQAFTVFMTHQVNIKLSYPLTLFERPLNLLSKKIIQKHDALWIPSNDKGISFAGDLSLTSKKTHPNIYYTGLLSRFKNKKPGDQYPEIPGVDNNYILCIISGPEPQRSIFEDTLIEQLTQSDNSSILLRGMPGSNNKQQRNNCIIYDHTSTSYFGKLIQGASLVISRPGYSTLMDLSVFGSKALLIPTPGQPEQEYLASLFHERRWCYSVNQGDINLGRDIPKALRFDGIPRYTVNNNSLNSAIDDMLYS